MSNSNSTNVSNTAAEITFTVKDGDTVVGTIAKVKNQPAKGLLVVIAGNPMAFMPNGCMNGRSDADKAARRAELAANPGAEVTVTVMGEPSIDTSKGKPQGRIKVSEQRATIAAEKVVRSQRAAERTSLIEAEVAGLSVGSVVEGTVKGIASRPSERNPEEAYVYGAFIQVSANVSGLLHIKQVDGGLKALERIIEDGTVVVEVIEARMEGSTPRVQLSQKSVVSAAMDAAFFDQYPVGTKTRGQVSRVGEVEGDLHGRIVTLASGAEVFLADQDMHVKSEANLARGATTRVVITGERVGKYVRVTRQGV